VFCFLCGRCCLLWVRYVAFWGEVFGFFCCGFVFLGVCLSWVAAVGVFLLCFVGVCVVVWLLFVGLVCCWVMSRLVGLFFGGVF
ncbi:hypothetical protein, partial [Acinetobacter baumannii]